MNELQTEDIFAELWFGIIFAFYHSGKIDTNTDKFTQYGKYSDHIREYSQDFTELFQNFQKRQYFALVQKVTDWLAESQGW